MNKTELRRFNCPVLGGVALIEITKRYRAADQLSQPQLARIDFTNCANSLQCGIATEVSYGNWTFDWDKCPAARKKSLTERGGVVYDARQHWKGGDPKKI